MAPACLDVLIMGFVPDVERFESSVFESSNTNKAASPALAEGQGREEECGKRGYG